VGNLFNYKIISNTLLLLYVFNFNFSHLSTFILILIQMISRIITRGLSTAARLCLPSTTALAGPKYHFGRVNKASESTTSFKKTIED